MVKIAVPLESDPNEGRVAATPDTVKRFKALGLDVVIQSGAGLKSRLPDEAFEAEGAQIVGDLASLVAGADIILRVRRPSAADIKAYPSGAMVIAQMDPYGHEGDVAAMAEAGLTSVAMEFMPRITRAQVMDVLSSQANLAGYQAVIDAAQIYDRAMPMMMTAAGTVPAARVFVMGAGVAGLQAIATAGGWVRLFRQPMCVPPPRSRWKAWAQSSSLWRMTSSSRPKPQAGMPRKCRTITRSSRVNWLQLISPSRTL